MDDEKFHKYIRLKSRLQSIEQNYYQYMKEYWNSSVGGFDFDEISDNRFRFTSTCFCIRSLLRHQKLTTKFQNNFQTDILDKIKDNIMKHDWKSETLKELNIYTTPIVIDTLFQIDNSIKNSKINKGIETILDSIDNDGSCKFDNFSSSAYLTYWAAIAISSFLRHNQDSDMSKKINEKLIAMTKWSEDTINRQISAYVSEDFDVFDPMQLAYALVLYVEFCSEINKVRENQRLIEKSIECIFSSQQKNGLWSKSNPIFVINDRGNVYPFAFEMLDVLFSLPTKYSKIFTKYLDNLETIVKWVEENKLEFKVSKTVHGWRSNHVAKPIGSPESWSTAVVFNTIFRIQKFVALLLNQEIVNEFSGEFALPPDSGKIKGIKTSNVIICKNEMSIKSIIDDHFIKPRQDNSGNNSTSMYSAILFGPPGTSKTKWAEAIASSLGWNMIKFQSGDFLTDGMEKATGRARYIFDRLFHLEDTVILFDEIEEFVKSRDGSGGEKADLFNRMTTTSMLTLINDLRSKEKTIFIVATNYLEEFDSAVQRPGRFDMVLLVGPPSKESMKEIASEFHKEEKIGERINLDIINNTIDEKYVGHLEYFIFNELSLILKDLNEQVKTGLGERDIKKILNSMIDDNSRSTILRTEGLKKKVDESKKKSRIGG